MLGAVVSVPERPVAVKGMGLLPGLSMYHVTCTMYYLPFSQLDVLISARVEKGHFCIYNVDVSWRGALPDLGSVCSFHARCRRKKNGISREN